MIDAVVILKENIFLEHIAILQYLHHMFFIKNEKLRREIEEIVKDEMMHMHMFASRAVSLGERISLQSVEGDIFFDPELNFEKFIEADIEAEEKAASKYLKDIDVISDDTSKIILERVFKDEKKHHAKFKSMLQEIKSSDPKVIDTKAKIETICFVNDFVRRIYKEILKYLEILFNDSGFKKDMAFQNAIESMKAFARFGEEMANKNIYLHIKCAHKFSKLHPSSSYFKELFRLEEYNRRLYMEPLIKAEGKKEHKNINKGDLTIGDLTVEE